MNIFQSGKILSVVAILTITQLLFLGCKPVVEEEIKVPHTVNEKKEISHTVDLVIDGKVTTVKVSGGKPIGKEVLPTPTKPHFKAVWYTDEQRTQKWNNKVPFTKSSKLFLKWEKITFTVTFVSNGAKVLPQKSVQSGDSISDLPTPVKDKFTFQGWYSDSNYTTKVTTKTKVSSDMTLYAKWDLMEFKVTFNLGSSVPNVSYTAKHGQVIDTPQKHTVPGYTFAGWFTDETYHTTVVFPHTVTDDIVFYAKWLAEYTITLDFDHAGNIGTSVVAHGKKLRTPPNPVRDHYTFDAWYTAKNGNGTRYDFTKKVTSSFTLYANWTIKSYRVSYVSRYAKAPRSGAHEYGTVIDEPPFLTSAHFKHTGWNYILAGDAAGVLARFPLKVTGNIVLTAVWTQRVIAGEPKG